MMTWTRSAAAPVFVLLCALLLVACPSTPDKPDKKDPSGGTVVTGTGAGGAAPECGEECTCLCPPKDSGDGPDTDWVQVQLGGYGSGGMMLSVNVSEHDKGSDWNNESNIRVWAGLGAAPASKADRPSDADTRILSPTDYELPATGYMWGGSTIVRTPPGTTKVWAYVEVKLNSAKTPPDPPGEFSFWLTWDLPDPISGWRESIEYP